ncbi:MAG: lysylphosphatidylglycerol synthase transmembrane domain-containing protein [Gammaproteobacteria bacterium]|nr:MAG: lysylphosphatidylglycerol synthase transmembrane domain-containing protein [Gammaproteobacteria bacterium]
MKKWLTTILVVAVTSVLLGYALWNVDLVALGDALAGADYRFVAPFLATLTLFFWTKAWRWALILEPLGRYSIRQVAPAMMIGFAANNVLPAHLGEIVRSVWFARRYRQRVSAVLVSQVLERILDVAAILLLYLLAVPWIESPPEAIRFSVWVVGAIAAAMAAVIYAMLAWPQRVFGLWRVLGGWLPASLQSRAAVFLNDVLRALSSVRSPGRLLLLVVNSVIQWSLMGVCVWMSMAAIGVIVGPAVTIIVLTATVVAVTLPNAPGYVGALQAAFVFALQPFGVPSESAFAASVFYLVVNWVPITGIGGLLMWATRWRA